MKNVNSHQRSYDAQIFWSSKDTNLSRIIPYISASLKNNEKLKLTPPLDTGRDFLFVDDLSELILKIIETPVKKAETSTYNVGSGKVLSIQEIISAFESSFLEKP